MYLRMRGDSFTGNIFAEIESITNKGLLYFRHIVRDESKGTVLLPFCRYPILRTRTKLLGAMLSHKYDKTHGIPSNIMIRNVIDVEIRNLVQDEKLDALTILFGLKIEGNCLYVCSAEEDEGRTLFEAEIRTTELDIEISDEGEV